MSTHTPGAWTTVKRETLQEMREALEEADMLYSTYGLLAARVECGAWINKVRAAIAKAKGETP